MYLSVSAMILASQSSSLVLVAIEITFVMADDPDTAIATFLVFVDAFLSNLTKHSFRISGCFISSLIMAVYLISPAYLEEL